MSTKGQLFVKEVIARLKGDNAEATASKIGRKAISAFEGQLAGLNANKIDQETAVEDAEEALKTAIYPTEMFSSNEAYIRNIVSAQERLDNAIEELAATEKSIKYFSSILEKF